MTRLLPSTLALITALMIACGSGDDDEPRVTAAQICAATAEPEGTVSAGDLIETSGIAASRSQDGILWAHNDSGDTARFFALGIEEADGGPMAREYAAGAKTAESEHLFNGLSKDPAQHEIGLQALADLVPAGTG